jgi:hypothetical protein
MGVQLCDRRYDEGIKLNLSNLVNGIPTCPRSIMEYFPVKKCDFLFLPICFWGNAKQNPKFIIKGIFLKSPSC